MWFVFVFWFFRYLTRRARLHRARQRGLGQPAEHRRVRLAPLFGIATDRLGRASARPGPAPRRDALPAFRRGFRDGGAVLPSAVFAILALSLSSACVNGAEAPFFTTATAIGAGSPGAAAGVLNLMGNLGGVLSIWLVPRMSAAWGWIGTLVFWSGVCVLAALLWLTIDVEEAPASTRAA